MHINQTSTKVCKFYETFLDPSEASLGKQTDSSVSYNELKKSENEKKKIQSVERIPSPFSPVQFEIPRDLHGRQERNAEFF